MKKVPDRGGAWFTLALAQYRNGDWQAADEADQNSIKCARGGETSAHDWLLLAMIRAQQGHTEEAHEWYEKTRDWIAEGKSSDDLLSLAAEAAALIPAP